jgi:endonuclease/exonuclease/phosphatase family metal-dependent hydrolase
MKRFFKTLLISLALILTFFVLFYFWAQQPNLSKDAYTKIEQYNKFINDNNDSILNVITYNIGYLSGMNNNTVNKLDKEYYDANLNKVIDLLKTSNADIIGFQEIDFGSNRSFDVNQNTSIANSLYNYSASAINWDKKYVPFPYWPITANFKRMLSGQSILSKYPIEKHERIILEKVRNNPFYYNAFYIDRLAQVCIIRTAIKKVCVINVHTEAFEQSTRINQLNYIMELYKKMAIQMPIILIGDFNSSPDYENSGILKFLNDKNIACAGFNNIATELTFPSYKPIERIDYIFYSKNDFIELESGILTKFGEISDHLPVYAKLKFK